MEEWDWKQLPSFMLACYRDAHTEGLLPGSAPHSPPSLSGSLRSSARDPQQKQAHSSLCSCLARSEDAGSAWGLKSLRIQSGKAPGALVAEGWSSRRKGSLTEGLPNSLRAAAT